MRRLAIVIALLAPAVLAPGCGQRAPAVPDPAADRRPVRVVATTARVARLVAEVGEEHVRVTTLVPRGADPRRHVLDARAGERVRGADLVVRSGGGVDAWLAPALRGAPAGLRVMTLADRAVQPGEERWWEDPRNAIAAVGALRGAFAQLDPEHIPDYARAAERAAERLRRAA